MVARTMMRALLQLMHVYAYVCSNGILMARQASSIRAFSPALQPTSLLLVAVPAVPLAPSPLHSLCCTRCITCCACVVASADHTHRGRSRKERLLLGLG